MFCVREIFGGNQGGIVPAWPGTPENEVSWLAGVPPALLLLEYTFQHRVS